MDAGGSCLLVLVVASFHFVDSQHSSDIHGDDPSPSKYPVCGENYQSPINIEPSSTVYSAQYANFTFDNYASTPNHVAFKMFNNGHTVQVNIVNESIGITAGGLPNHYTLAQFHFHWGSIQRVGSEHTIDGHAYPMELHLVHYDSSLGNISNAANSSLGLAVLGVFLKIGDQSNKALDIMVDNFDKIKYKDVDMTVELNETFPLEWLLPSNTADYYRYNGSLTTAPCYESVIWTVFKDPIVITRNQMAAFRRLCKEKKKEGNCTPIVNNFRPVKPLNGRTVYRSFEDLDVTNTTTTDDVGTFAFSSHVLLYSAIFAFLATKLAI